MTSSTKQLLLIASVAITLSSCKNDDSVRQISQAPADSIGNETTLAQSRPGTFALRARVRYEDIETLASEQLPTIHPVSNSKRVCKRIIGIRACGTARWDLTIIRPGKLSFHGHEGIVYLQTPIRFDGTVGVEGRVARALGLSALDVAGEALTRIALSVQMGENWCPSISADVSYEWREKPTLVYQNALDFSLETIMNEALDKQLAKVETRLNDAIDCAAFQNQLNSLWRSYSFALELPATQADEAVQKMHLNIVPTDFAFSGLRTEEDKLGVSFALGANTVVETQPQAARELELPPLRQVSFTESRTDFDLIVRASYTQLEQLISPRLIDREFSTDSPAGNVSVTITSFELSGNASDVTVALGFSSKLPGHRRNINGLVYLQANPVVNADTEELVLENIRLSRVLDSNLWVLLSRVFENQIISALERNSVQKLAPRLRKLENSLTEQLQDPSRTAGLSVKASNLSINIMEVVAERDALAARARVSTEFDIDVPLTVIQKPLR